MNRYVFNFELIDLIESLLPIDLVGHYVVKVISCHETIVVQIGFKEDMLDFLVIEILS